MGGMNRPPEPGEGGAGGSTLTSCIRNTAGFCIENPRVSAAATVGLAAGVLSSPVVAARLAAGAVQVAGVGESQEQRDWATEADLVGNERLYFKSIHPNNKMAIPTDVGDEIKACYQDRDRRGLESAWQGQLDRFNAHINTGIDTRGRRVYMIFTFLPPVAAGYSLFHPVICVTNHDDNSFKTTDKGFQAAGDGPRRDNMMNRSWADGTHPVFNLPDHPTMETDRRPIGLVYLGKFAGGGSSDSDLAKNFLRKIRDMMFFRNFQNGIFDTMPRIWGWSEDRVSRLPNGVRMIDDFGDQPPYVIIYDVLKNNCQHLATTVMNWLHFYGAYRVDHAFHGAPNGDYGNILEADIMQVRILQHLESILPSTVSRQVTRSIPVLRANPTKTLRPTRMENRDDIVNPSDDEVGAASEQPYDLYVLKDPPGSPNDVRLELNTPRDTILTYGVYNYTLTRADPPHLHLLYVPHRTTDGRNPQYAADTIPYHTYQYAYE